MSVRKLKDSLANLGKATANLERALTIPRDRELVFEGLRQINRLADVCIG